MAGDLLALAEHLDDADQNRKDDDADDVGLDRSEQGVAVGDNAADFGVHRRMCEGSESGGGDEEEGNLELFHLWLCVCVC